MIIKVKELYSPRVSSNARRSNSIYLLQFAAAQELGHELVKRKFQLSLTKPYS